MDAVAWPSLASGDFLAGDGIETSCHSHPPSRAKLPLTEGPMDISVRTHPSGIGLGRRLSQLRQRVSWTSDDAPSLDWSGRLDDSGKATLDESQSSASSRRISTIGQFLLGLNGGRNPADGAAGEEGDDAGGAAGAERDTGNDPRNRGGDGGADGGEEDDAGGAAGAERGTRNGPPITAAEIGSGVIFPVSSDDCLVGLDPAAVEFDEFRARRRM